jgi:IPT/TIG domain
MPTVLAVVPSNVPTTDGTVVTITGSGFIGAQAVSFGGTHDVHGQLGQADHRHYTRARRGHRPGHRHRFDPSPAWCSSERTGLRSTVLSDTQVVATAPPGTGTVQVTVTTPGGVSNGLPYEYVPPPEI